MADVAAGSEAGVSVLVVDDHDVVHWGFRVLLDRQPWVERCDAAADAETALELIGRHHHDVALVDLFLGQSSGAELCEEIHAISADTDVLLVSGAGSISAVVAKAAGAAGFVSKDLLRQGRDQRRPHGLARDRGVRLRSPQGGRPLGPGARRSSA